VDLRYGEPVPIAAATVRVSVRYDDGSTHALEDANLLVRRPGATGTAIPRYHQRP
jgi:hypothetical protein